MSFDALIKPVATFGVRKISPVPAEPVASSVIFVVVVTILLLSTSRFFFKLISLSKPLICKKVLIAPALTHAKSIEPSSPPAVASLIE